MARREMACKGGGGPHAPRASARHPVTGGGAASGTDVAEDGCMTSHISPVIVGFDFSHSGSAALRRAVTLAAHAPIHVLHVVCVIEPEGAIPSIPSYNGIDYMYAARVQEILAAEIQRELDEAEVASRVHFFVHARVGRASQEILSLAREVGADLIILGSHGMTGTGIEAGIECMLLGSVSECVVREAGCTVEIARPKRYPEVTLFPIEAVEPHHTYVPPHRYTYEDHRVNLRPAEWPLY